MIKNIIQLLNFEPMIVGYTQLDIWLLIQGHDKAVNCLVLTSSVGIFASGSDDHNIHVWKIHETDDGAVMKYVVTLWKEQCNNFEKLTLIRTYYDVCKYIGLFVI